MSGKLPYVGSAGVGATSGGGERKPSRAAAPLAGATSAAVAASPSSNNELAALFECPVCYDYVLPPILQCQSGHLVCSSCRSKLTCCPTCRGALGKHGDGDGLTTAAPRDAARSVSTGTGRTGRAHHCTAAPRAGGRSVPTYVTTTVEIGSGGMGRDGVDRDGSQIEQDGMGVEPGRGRKYFMGRLDHKGRYGVVPKWAT